MADILDEVTDLPSTDGYLKQDRFRDFRMVFLQSEEGKKVLSEMLSWARMFQQTVTAVPVDPYLMALNEGRRSFAVKLLDTLYREPREFPAKQKRKTNG